MNKDIEFPECDECSKKITCDTCPTFQKDEVMMLNKNIDYDELDGDCDTCEYGCTDACLSCPYWGEDDEE